MVINAAACSLASWPFPQHHIAVVFAEKSFDLETVERQNGAMSRR